LKEVAETPARRILYGREEVKLSDGENAELLVYLVREEKDIYIGVIVLVCHLASWAQPS
jgi:hypothetical protein